MAIWARGPARSPASSTTPTGAWQYLSIRYTERLAEAERRRLGRLPRRQLRQRPRRDGQRALQGRADPPAWATGEAVEQVELATALGPLVEHRAPPHRLRRRAARRVRGRPLRSTTTDRCRRPALNRASTEPGAVQPTSPRVLGGVRAVVRSRHCRWRRLSRLLLPAGIPALPGHAQAVRAFADAWYRRPRVSGRARRTGALRTLVEQRVVGVTFRTRPPPHGNGNPNQSLGRTKVRLRCQRRVQIA